MDDEEVLRDGAVVTVRRAEPGDREALHALDASMPREDVRLRFFSPTADVTGMLDRLLDSRNTNVVALAGQELLGHGMYAPLDGDRAEIAFTVADAAKGRGVGTLLLERLAERAASLRRCAAAKEPSGCSSRQPRRRRRSHATDAHPEIAELDINPVVVSPSGALAVDARVRVELP